MSAFIRLWKQAVKDDAADRARIKTSNFGIPERARTADQKKKSGNYPIHDRGHARMALSLGKKHLSPAKYAALKRRIHAKYPDLAKSAELSRNEPDGLTTGAGGGDRLPRGPLGLPEGTGEALNRAAGLPGRGLGRLEGRRGRRRAALLAMLAERS